MAPLVLLNATPFVAGYDFTGDSNKIQFDASLPTLDVTTFAGSGWKSVTGGLKDATAHLDGFWGSSPDSEAFTGLGVTDQAVTVSPTGLAGSIAYMLRTEKMKYSAFGAAVGAAAPFALDLSASNSQGLVRGQLAAAKQAVSATGAIGSGLNLGAVGSAQYLYANLHAFAVGTTITAVVESDTSGAFAAPTTRGTLGPITAVGGTWLTRVAGPITDTWWRVRISAITGTFTVAASIGIQ